MNLSWFLIRILLATTAADVTPLTLFDKQALTRFQVKLVYTISKDAENFVCSLPPSKKYLTPPTKVYI